jgi:hypothetical protein
MESKLCVLSIIGKLVKDEFKLQGQLYLFLQAAQTTNDHN